LAPRFAHWILPIPGKGPSEWWYSWVPVVAPCVGAVLGGLFAKSMKHMLVAGLYSNKVKTPFLKSFGPI
jgi:hypothetical protein